MRPLLLPTVLQPLLLLLLLPLACCCAEQSELRYSSSGAAGGGRRQFRRRLPSALIIGVKKGGTRALLSFIRQHPDVQAPGPEVHFFDRHFRRGLRWYRRQMPRSLRSQVTMEKTPGYFAHPLAPSRAAAANPRAKVVLVVRDPVTRALSDYAQAQANARRSGRRLRPFESLAFANSSAASLVVDSRWPAVRLGLYALHLRRWLATFPRRQLLIVSGELLASRPADVLAQLQRFLGLQQLVTERHFYFDQRKGFPCLKKARRGGRPRCLAEGKGRRHPRVSPAALRALRRFYAPSNRLFYRLAGTDFRWPEQ